MTNVYGDDVCDYYGADDCDYDGDCDNYDYHDVVFYLYRPACCSADLVYYYWRKNQKTHIRCKVVLGRGYDADLGQYLHYGVAGMVHCDTPFLAFPCRDTLFGFFYQ